MKMILQRIALAIGFILFLIATGIGWLRGVGLWIALYRGLMIMAIGSLVVFLFMRFFALILFDFIAEQKRIRQEELAREEAARQEATRKTREKLMP